MEKTLMKLKLFRVGKGMNMDQFAEAVGYARRHYSNIEKGITEPTARLARGISEAFNITLIEAYALFIPVEDEQK